MSNSEHPLDIRQNNSDNDDSIIRGRSLSMQSRRSWPLLPTLQVINSNESGSNRFNVRSPIIDEEIQRKSSSSSSSNESDTSSEYSSSEKEKGEVREHDKDNENLDEKDINRRRSTVHNTRRSSAGTLVEAALDQEEARDRHVRFPEHIAEAGNLVERMLSIKYPNQTTSPTLGNSKYNTIDEHEPISDNDNNVDLELERTHSSKNTYTNTGSVLASLMKLEAKRHESVKKRKSSVKKKKV